MVLAVTHWVEVALEHMEGLELHIREALLPDLLQHHTVVVTAIASHMRLTSANMLRSTWMAAAMLGRSAVKAQSYAASFQDYLIRRPAGNMTGFERDFAENDALMTQLGLFADASPPQLLWRGEGRYRDLYIHLAARFLSAPDHVLDCEGTHALWKWVETFKRNVSFRLLNCTLRTRLFPKVILRSHRHADSSIIAKPSEMSTN